MILFSLLAFFLLASFCLASVDEVYNKSISNGATILLNESSFTIRIGQLNNSIVVLVSPQNISHILEEGDCYRVGYDEFCYDYYDVDQKIQALMYDYTPKLEVSRDETSFDLFVGNSFNVTTTFENTGGTYFDELYFEEILPRGLTITDSEGCYFEDNKVYFEKGLFIDNTTSCTYTVRVDEVVDLTYVGSFNLTNFDADYLVADPLDEIDVASELPFSFSITPESSIVSMDDLVIIRFNLSYDDEDVNLTLNRFGLYYDDKEFNPYSSQIYAKLLDEETFSLNKTIEGAVPFENTYALTPKKVSDNLTIYFFVNYSVDDDSAYGYFEIPIKINTSYIPLECNAVITIPDKFTRKSLDKLNQSLMSYSEYDFKLELVNKNSVLDLNNVRIKAKSNFFDFDSEFESSIDSTGPKEIYSSHGFFNSTTNEEYFLDVNISYRSNYNQKFEKECFYKFTVESLPLISIEKQFDLTSEIVDGIVKNVSRITVYATNNFYKSITVDFTETIPEFVFITKPLTNTRYKIDPQERVKIYSYDIIIPAEHVSLALETENYYSNYANQLENSTMSNVTEINDSGDVLLNTSPINIEDAILRSDDSLSTTSISYRVNGFMFEYSSMIELPVSEIIAHSSGLEVNKVIDEKLKNIKSEIENEYNAKLENALENASNQSSQNANAEKEKSPLGNFIVLLLLILFVVSFVLFSLYNHSSFFIKIEDLYFNIRKNMIRKKHDSLVTQHLLLHDRQKSLNIESNNLTDREKELLKIIDEKKSFKNKLYRHHERDKEHYNYKLKRLDEDKKKLMDKIERLKSDIANLDSKKIPINLEIDKINKEDEAIQKELSELESKEGKIQTTKKTVHEYLDHFESKESTLKQRISGFEDEEMTALKESLDLIDKKIEQLNVDKEFQTKRLIEEKERLINKKSEISKELGLSEDFLKKVDEVKNYDKKKP